MNSERISRNSVKITVNRAAADEFESALKAFKSDLYSAIFITSIIMSIEEKYNMNFTNGQISVELIKSENSGVIYISKIKSYYKLATRKNYSQVKYSKTINCIFENFNKLMEFIKKTFPCIFSSSQLVTDGSKFVLVIEYKTDIQNSFLKEKELCHYIEGHSLYTDNNYVKIIENNAISQLRSFLS